MLRKKTTMYIEEQTYQDLITRIHKLEQENSDLKQKCYSIKDINQCFRYALEKTSIVIFRQDKDLKYKWVHNPNPLFKTEDTLEKTDYDLLPFHEAFKLEKIKNNVLKTGKSAKDLVETTVQGETFFYELFVSPWLDQNNEIMGVTCLSADITEKETELIRAKEKAEENDRLKTAFLHNMSHEIRTPINAISGFAAILNNQDVSEEKQKSYIEIIQKSSNQLLSIVSDILTISSLETKQEVLSITNVCINKIIAEVFATFKQQAGNRNILFNTKQHLNDLQSEIHTDKNKITQILSNLLSNAFKFTHEGYIEFGYNLKSEYLEFYVKDSGIGIKSEFHDDIFEPFRQADDSLNQLYGGTGLGLAISKAFVELLGGKMWVQSKPEKGSVFYFTIPYLPVNDLNIPVSTSKANENFKTIIVAEDEEFNFLYIEALLDNSELKLIHTHDGEETVEVFKANPDIDLILMDIRMPIMTGDEAAKIIKAIKPDLPIIAQSAYALEQERAKYEGIFDDYLIKPFNKDSLLDLISNHIEIQKK
jgi:signal transduction histidine kinase/CheY-like chemotaxis protein